MVTQFSLQSSIYRFAKEGLLVRTGRKREDREEEEEELVDSRLFLPLCLLLLSEPLLQEVITTC